MVTLKLGQIWKNRRARPDSLFLITKLYERHYPKSGGSAQRVKGVVVHGDEVDAGRITSNDLDARSLAQMYPCLMFDPPYQKEVEDK